MASLRAGVVAFGVWLSVFGFATSSAPRLALGAATSDAAPVVLFGFDGSPDEPRWVVVNDGVMGGVSSSTVSIARGTLRFSGQVRLENNGGFVSVRSGQIKVEVAERFAAGSAVRLRLRGSNTPVRVTIETAAGWYWATVTPKTGWSTVTVPYGAFLPRTRFGQPVNDAAYNGQPVIRVGMLISNARAERFSIEVDSIVLR